APGRRGRDGSPSPARVNVPRTVFPPRRSGSRSVRRTGRSHFPRGVHAVPCRGTVSTGVRRKAVGSATGCWGCRLPAAEPVPAVVAARAAASAARLPGVFRGPGGPLPAVVLVVAVGGPERLVVCPPLPLSVRLPVGVVPPVPAQRVRAFRTPLRPL